MSLFSTQSSLLGRRDENQEMHRLIHRLEGNVVDNYHHPVGIKLRIKQVLRCAMR